MKESYYVNASQRVDIYQTRRGLLNRSPAKFTRICSRRKVVHDADVWLIRVYASESEDEHHSSDTVASQREASSL